MEVGRQSVGSGWERGDDRWRGGTKPKLCQDQDQALA